MCSPKSIFLAENRLYYAWQERKWKPTGSIAIE